MFRKVASSIAPYKTAVRRLAPAAATQTAAAHAATSASEASKKAVLQLVRFDPVTNSSRVESYEYDKHHEYMVLDLLIALKAHQDPTLAFRSSCCEGVCGSCAMNINGINSLACVTFAPQVTTVGPLPNFPVIKDFVVDLRYFFQQYAYIRPFVRNANLYRNQIDNIVARYHNFNRVMYGVSPTDGHRLEGAVPVENPKTQTEVVALLRLADVFVQSGNVTQLINALEQAEKCGVSLDNAKVTELVELTLKNHKSKSTSAKA